MTGGWRRGGPGACVLVLWLLGTGAGARPVDRPGGATPLDRWLAGQAGVRTWSARLTQTRTFPTLTHPLVSPGRVWFAVPGRFRWQLEDPPQTIAVRDGETLRMLYPRLGREERVDLQDPATGPWREALVLFEAGFPGSRADLERRFEVLSQATVGDRHRVTLRPRTTASRRWLRQMVLELAVTDLALQATRLEFADGSTLRNEFEDIEVNAELEADLFAPVLAGGPGEGP